jgi:hypothetical protein
MNNTLLKHQWVTEVKKGRNPKVPKFQWKWKYNLLELVRHSKAHAKEKVYSYKCLHLKNRDFSKKSLWDFAPNDAP